MAEGQTIDVTALRGELGVSLTAVREALRVLAAKGLVDARQKRGTFVRERAEWRLLDADVLRWRFASHADTQLLDDLHEVRRIIEPAVARLAADRATAGDVEELESALDAMGQAGATVEAAVAADLAFHRALARATHNELLVHVEADTTAGLAGRDELVHGAMALADPVPSHRMVVDAVRAKSPDDAEQAMNGLLDEASRDLRHALRKDGSGHDSRPR